MQHKSLPAEFKVHAEKREIEGYAATFGNVDAVSDCGGPDAPPA